MTSFPIDVDGVKLPPHAHGLYGNTAAWLALNNPVPDDKQLVIETDTLKMKVGDDTTAYLDLPYLIDPDVQAALATLAAQIASINVGLRFLAAGAVSTTNIASRSGTVTVDTIPLTAGKLVLLVGQTSASQNGPWVIQTGAWTRPTNYATGSDATGMSVYVEGGSVANVGTWAVSGDGPYIVDTNVTTWIQLTGLGGIVLGTALTKSGNTLNVDLGTVAGKAAEGDSIGKPVGKTGLTGATAATRYVGATTSGPPTSGTFLKGDWINDQNGLIFTCTTAGSPGTWTIGNKVAMLGADATSNLTLTGTVTDVPGATVSITPAVAGTAVVHGSFDFSGVTSGDTLIGVLTVDSTQQTQQCNFVAQAANTRMVLSRTWHIPLTAAAHTLKLRGQRAGGSGAANLINSGHSGIQVEFYPGA